MVGFYGIWDMHDLQHRSYQIYDSMPSSFAITSIIYIVLGVNFGLNSALNEGIYATIMDREIVNLPQYCAWYNICI